MDIAALILAPLILALIYSWPKINTLPSLVRVGLPVALMAIVFIALVGYIPAVQEAVITKTPLIRIFELRNFALHLDGVSLLFGLLMTGAGAMIALYAGTFFAESDVHRRFVRGLMALVGAMLGFLLTDYADTLPVFWVLTAIFVTLFIDFDRQDETQAAGRRSRAWNWLHMSRFFILVVGMKILQEAGAIAKGMTQPLVEISQISTANLSSSSTYELALGLILGWIVLETLYTVFQWRAAKHMSVSAHAVVFIAKLLSIIYPLARLYPALHDNPLWWNTVTGIGLLIMLVGSVWALRQRETKAMLVSGSMSGFGACVALIGLPEFLGVKVALIGIVVFALSQAALFLSTDMHHKRARWVVVGLAVLPLAIFHLIMIGAFYQVTLAWSGIALAIVVVSTALWVVSAIRIIRDKTDPVGARYTAPSLWIPPLALALTSLLCIALFDAIFALLLNPMLTKQPLAGDTITPLILGITALIGGMILYATRDSWMHRIGEASLTNG